MFNRIKLWLRKELLHFTYVESVQYSVDSQWMRDETIRKIKRTGTYEEFNQVVKEIETRENKNSGRIIRPWIKV